MFVHEVEDTSALCAHVLQGCQRVWDALGCGQNEAVYQQALEHELRSCGYVIIGTAPVPIYYKGLSIGFCLPDIRLPGERLVIELKAIAADIRKGNTEGKAQLASYMRLLDYDYGMLVNFPKRVQQSEAVKLESVCYKRAEAPQVSQAETRAARQRAEPLRL